MENNDYEYRGLIAESWDLIRGDPSEFPDRDFYHQIIESSGEPVLDVGCGTGRLLLEFLERGLDAEGVDISPEMIEICRQKAQALSLPLTVYTQGIEAMGLPRRYRTIIVPSCSFQLVPDIEQARKALSGFYKHLLPGGMLVLSIWHIQNKGTGEWGDWWQVADKKGFRDGKRVRRWERSMYDAKTQLRHTENRYELLVGEEILYSELHRRSPEMRNYTLNQLISMLEEAGFTAIQAVSFLTGEPASEDDESFYIYGKKP